ncbi:hypothetical protein [Actinomadura rubrisoli]|uniref:Uncharacterized protein n=1 Tax=Actinomadura rubrisoli TaxID=2530368 RepID=A0A4R5BNQ4_9ACTN|nr:hypothetical protein [Actinomadura rubrisoli]TDD86800.1 hypothetical protein E1298_16860 [Actinomadura rubrisoli]
MNGTTQTDPLASLGAHLGARGLKVELTAQGLKVTNKAVPGCCDHVPHPSVMITCRRRLDDGARMWFVTSWGEPIAEAGKITDAAVAVCHLLKSPATAGDQR